MSNLIQELKQEHAEILDILATIKELGIGTVEGQERLLSLRAKLLTHLGKEDLQLYPVLHAWAPNNDHLAQVLKSSAAEMEQITQFATYFFSTYPANGLGFEFAKDAGKLFATLKARILNEENILYREYERLKTG